MPNPSGLCKCGCGAKTKIAAQTNTKLGHVKGQPFDYLRGHWNRSVPPPVKTDRGYKSLCHIYQGQIDKLGYPRREEGRGKGPRGTVLVHRQIWIAANGPLSDGMDVHHLCRQRDCVRLSHLAVRSRSEHLRTHRGVPPEKYAAICEAIRSGEESQGAIARRFGVTKPYIWELRRSLLA